MNEIARKAHWERAWSQKDETETSWFQTAPELSLELIAAAGARPDDPFIDVGGGASRLVDHLLDRGFSDLTVLDISAAGLQRARRRLGARAARVHWIEADVTTFRPQRDYRVWHDRAVFHFLLDAAERARYVAAMDAALASDGQAVIATFGPDGPLRCSGLDTLRYGAADLAAALGSRWRLLEERAEAHRTPTDREQRFGYYRFARAAVRAAETG
ncbi:MAG: class I SAM-dependent methyltransferase [Xanthomonadales bacterium]